MKKALLTTMTFAVAVVLGLWQGWRPMAAEAQSGRRGEGNTAQNAPREQDSFEERLWNWLQTVQYRNWAPAPGQTGDFYPGQEPHGAQLKMYLNRTAVANPEDLPPGSIIVKENFTPEQELAAITIMYRVEGYDPENHDWYWVKYRPNGEVDRTPPDKGSRPIAGRFPSCINCHSGAQGNDLAFFNDGRK